MFTMDNDDDIVVYPELRLLSPAFQTRLLTCLLPAHRASLTSTFPPPFSPAAECRYPVCARSARGCSCAVQVMAPNQGLTSERGRGFFGRLVDARRLESRVGLLAGALRHCRHSKPLRTPPRAAQPLAHSSRFPQLAAHHPSNPARHPRPHSPLTPASPIIASSTTDLANSPTHHRRPPPGPHRQKQNSRQTPIRLRPPSGHSRSYQNQNYPTHPLLPDCQNPY